jgi:hypothetical protein
MADQNVWEYRRVRLWPATRSYAVWFIPQVARSPSLRSCHVITRAMMARTNVLFWFL